VAYDFRRDESGRMMPVGLLRARTAVVINTANVPQAAEQAALGDPLETLWRKAVFERCGVRDVRRAVFAPAQGASPEQRAGWCGEARALVRAAFAPS
jgi:putative NADPH-quinone reductase